MDLSKKHINILNSFDNDISKFNKELNLEMSIEKRIKKILHRSNRNVRDCILTGEIKIKMNKTIKQKTGIFKVEKSFFRYYYTIIKIKKFSDEGE